MPEDTDPFEEFRHKRLEQQKRQRAKKRHGEVAGDVEPDQAIEPDVEPGTGERYAKGKPKGFQSTKYPDVPKTKDYKKPKGFETHKFEPKKRD